MTSLFLLAGCVLLPQIQHHESNLCLDHPVVFLMMTVTTRESLEGLAAVCALELPTTVHLSVPHQCLLAVKHLLAGVTLMVPHMNQLVTLQTGTPGGLIVTFVT